MNETLRLVFAATLGFSLLILWQNWQEFEAANNVADAQPAVNQTTTDIPSVVTDIDVPTPTQSLQAEGGVPDVGDGDAIPTAVASSNRLIQIETDWLVAAVSEVGGNLVDVQLKKHLKNGEPLPLLEDSNRFYVAQSGLIGADGIPNHNARFTVLSSTPLAFDAGDGYVFNSADSQQALTVDLATESGGVRLTKRYIFHPSDYLVSMVLIANNQESQAKNLYGYFQLVHDGQTPRNYSSFLPTFFGIAMYTESSKFLKIDFEDAADTSYPRKSDNGWIGIIQRYFAAVWLPPVGDREFFMRRGNDGKVRVGAIVPLGEVSAASEKTVTMRLFVGAEEQAVLNRLNDTADAQGINLVVDYGWLTFIAVLLFDLLSAIQSVVGNWGVSIILSTVAIKLLFYPLSSAAYRSMAKMKEEAPRIKKMQEQFGDDKQRLQKEMMALYREKKINPLGGCLPILIQIPVFIALYWVLLGSVELRQAHFIGWIDDLSAPDPFYVLSLIMGVAMFLQTKLSPAPPDPTQAMVMRIMPIGFSLFSIFFPSGLVLYWSVNTLLSIAQQWYISRRIRAIRGK